MNYQQFYQAALQDTNWQQRVETALVHTAVNVKITDNPANALEERRSDLGRRIRDHSSQEAQRWALPVALGFMAAANLSAAAISDDDIFSRIDFIWDKMMEKVVSPAGEPPDPASLAPETAEWEWKPFPGAELDPAFQDPTTR